MPLLRVNNLQTHFHTRDGIVRAVDGVSFSLDPEETLGIVGESGSGKSVLNLSLMRLIPTPPGKIAGGTARFKKHDLLNMPMSELQKLRGDKIAMIFQDPMTSLNPLLTVGRQLTEVLEIHRNMTPREALKDAIQMLEYVGICDAPRRIHEYPHQFSGGMRQRVMIAMGLLCRPELLICDEPTTALDVTIQAQILDLLKNLQREFGTAIIFISHNLGVVAGFCDRVAVMYAGRIVEHAPTDSLFARPTHPYSRALLASVPRLDEARHARLQSIRDQPPDLSRLPNGCRFHPRCDLMQPACQRKIPRLVTCGAEHTAACWVTVPAAAAEIADELAITRTRKSALSENDDDATERVPRAEDAGFSDDANLDLGADAEEPTVRYDDEP